MINTERIKDALLSSGCDALLITGDINRRYLTGFDSSAGALVATADKAYFMTDSRYTEAASLAITDAEVIPIAGGTTYSSAINDITKRHGIESLGFEEEIMTYGEYARFSEKLCAKLIPAGKALTDIRAVKTQAELQKMIAAQRIAEKAFNEILPIISTDMTEKELSAELMCAFFRNGADDKSFDPIIVSGEKSSMPHGEPGDVKIKKGFLTMDFGVKLNGWCSDTTRTVCIGKPTDEMRKVYDTVLEAQLAGIAAARAGLKGSEVDGAARSVIADAGYGDFFGHSFGHGLGLEVHEAPNVSPKSEAILPSGAVISAEPGIYIPGKFGVRIEDVLFLTEDGCQNITNLPKELIIL